MDPSASSAAHSRRRSLSCCLRSLAGCTLLLLLFSGCASSDPGTPEPSGSMYYGSGFHDPWYYGAADYPADIIVTPPGRPAVPPHVENPIALPPSSASAARPQPSIPSAPRPAFHR